MITAAAIARNQQGTGKGIPLVFAMCLGLVGVWYLPRALSLRWQFAQTVARRLSPRTRRMHEWIVSAPATFGYVAIFTASTLVQRSAPPALISLLTKVDSTSLTGLRLAPLTVLAASAIWVADQGVGLIGYVAGFVTFVAWRSAATGLRGSS